MEIETPRSRRAASLSLALLLTLTAGCGTTLSASVRGSSRPNTEDCTPGQRVELPNGDFTIVQTCLDSTNQLAGDGIAEQTLWEFDMSDQDFAACYPETAVVEVELRPTGDLLDERLRVQDRWAMGLEAIQSLEVGREQTLSFDMMIRNGRPSPYSPSAIRDLLVANEGVLAMEYEFNALLSRAKIELACRR